MVSADIQRILNQSTEFQCRWNLIPEADRTRMLSDGLESTLEFDTTFARIHREIDIAADISKISLADIADPEAMAAAGITNIIETVSQALTNNPNISKKDLLNAAVGDATSDEIVDSQLASSHSHTSIVDAVTSRAGIKFVHESVIRVTDMTGPDIATIALDSLSLDEAYDAMSATVGSSSRHFDNNNERDDETNIINDVFHQRRRAKAYRIKLAAANAENRRLKNELAAAKAALAAAFASDSGSDSGSVASLSLPNSPVTSDSDDDEITSLTTSDDGVDLIAPTPIHPSVSFDLDMLASIQDNKKRVSFDVPDPDEEKISAFVKEMINDPSLIPSIKAAIARASRGDPQARIMQKAINRRLSL